MSCSTIGRGEEECQCKKRTRATATPQCPPTTVPPSNQTRSSYTSHSRVKGRDERYKEERERER